MRSHRWGTAPAVAVLLLGGCAGAGADELLVTDEPTTTTEYLQPDDTKYEPPPTTTTVAPTTTLPPPPSTTIPEPQVAPETQAPVAPPSTPQVSDGYNDPNNPAAWDRLAECEAWGDWSINTGNGYYGGLQFSLSSWRAVGGQGYPHENSREEQIRRGQMLWQQGGWRHWPACSLKLGYR